MQQIANNNNQAQYLEYMKDRMSKIHHGLWKKKDSQYLLNVHQQCHSVTLFFPGQKINPSLSYEWFIVRTNFISSSYNCF